MENSGPGSSEQQGKELIFLLGLKLGRPVHLCLGAVIRKAEGEDMLNIGNHDVICLYCTYGPSLE